MDVAGQNLPPVAHVHGHGEGFPSRCGAHVQHPVPRGGGGRHSGQTGRRVLDQEPSLPEGGQAAQIPGAGDLQAALQPGVGLHGDAVAPQLPFQVLRRGFQGVHLDAGGNGVVVQPQELLGLIGADQVQQPQHQPLGMAIPQGQVVRRGPLGQVRHIHPVLHKPPQHGVDHTGGLGPPVAAGHLHRLVDGGPVGHPVHKQYLIAADAQDAADHRLQPLRLLGAPAADVIVQQHPVLHHPIAQAGGKGRVPAVQPVLGDQTAQGLIGPGVGLVHLHQRIQGHIPGAALLPGAHASTCRGWPRR